MNFNPIVLFRNADATVELRGKWPRFTRLTPELLGGGIMLVDDTGHINIKLINASAVYKLSKIQETGQHWICLERVSYAGGDGE